MDEQTERQLAAIRRKVEAEKRIAEIYKEDGRGRSAQDWMERLKAEMNKRDAAEAEIKELSGPDIDGF